MRPLLATALAAGFLSVPATGAAVTVSSATAAVADPVHHVAVTGLSGASLTTWPAYDAAVSRFAVRPDGPDGGGLAVQVTSSDPAAVITVDGRPAANGQRRELPGVTSGDEVNVQITDAAGTSNQSWVVLPRGFPTIATTTAGAGPAPGLTAVTLRAGEGQDSYATLVDAHGVPSQVITHSMGSSDLNRQPNGSYTIAVALAEDLWGDHVIEEYDASFRKIATHRMAGHPRTDFHDSILLPGGGRILMAYIKAEDGQTDSWLQEVSPQGEVLLDWNSRDHVDRVNDPILNALGDYAHLNSMQVMHDGNLLLSLRHLNQVLKIDRRTGAVIWRLGGRRSTFDFVDDPLGGPCAQHTARELANGDIQVFDNGSGPAPSTSPPLCPTADDPEAEVYRPASRVTVYRLDEAAGEAHLVEGHDVGAFSQFAGSAQRLGAGTLDDHVMVGLNNAHGVPDGGDAPDALELDADGAVVWTLTAPGHATYRAAKLDAPDAIAPAVSIASPADGTVVQQGATLDASFACTDSGGSNLDGCSGTVANGASLTAEPGAHRLVVTATDRAGNTTTRSVGFTVVPGDAPPPPGPTPPVVPAVPTDPAARADAAIRAPGGTWTGRDVYTGRKQTVSLRTRPGASVVVHVRVRNSGDAPGRLTLRGTTGRRWTAGRWYAGRRDVTARLRAGAHRTPRLDPGESVRLRLVLRPGEGRPGRRTVVRLAARSRDASPDVVRARLTVR